MSTDGQGTSNRRNIAENLNRLSRAHVEFAEIMQYKGHYAVQGHSRLPILVPIESSHTISY